MELTTKDFFEYVGKDYNEKEEELPDENINSRVETPSVQASPESDYLVDEVDDTIHPGRWAVIKNSIYMECTDTANQLSPGVYVACMSMSGPYLRKKTILMDNIIDLPDENSDKVLAHIKEFWEMKSKFKSLGFLHKRGVLLWGPPGSGKTTTVFQTMKQLVTDYKGVIIYGNSPGTLKDCIEMTRNIEADRPLVVVMEDIDDTVDYYGDRAITELLDGESNVENCLFLATTNYPQRLPPRLVNRPSRFDVIEYIGFPGAEARKMYLSIKAPSLPPSTLQVWADKTEGLSIAHLKELIAAVLVFNKDLDETIIRLRGMAKNPFKTE